MHKNNDFMNRTNSRFSKITSLGPYWKIIEGGLTYLRKQLLGLRLTTSFSNLHIVMVFYVGRSDVYIRYNIGPLPCGP